MIAARQSFWLRWGPGVFGFGSVMACLLSGAGFVMAVALPIHGDKRIKALCNSSVETLLNSKDLVEVTRAGILIRRLDCSIRWRLPDE